MVNSTEARVVACSGPTSILRVRSVAVPNPVQCPDSRSPGPYPTAALGPRLPEARALAGVLFIEG